MNNIDMRNLRLHKFLYNKIDFLNNITEEINNNVNVTNKPKKEYKFTEKRKLAYEKMKEARKKKVKGVSKLKVILL